VSPNTCGTRDTKTTQLYIGENTGRGKAAAAKVSTLMAQMSRVS
jgi:hypothetical protein